MKVGPPYIRCRMIRLAYRQIGLPKNFRVDPLALVSCQEIAKVSGESVIKVTPRVANYKGTKLASGWHTRNHHLFISVYAGESLPGLMWSDPPLEAVEVPGVGDAAQFAFFPDQLPGIGDHRPPFIENRLRFIENGVVIDVSYFCRDKAVILDGLEVTSRLGRLAAERVPSLPTNS